MSPNIHTRDQAEVDFLYELVQRRIDLIRSQFGRIPTPRDLRAAGDKPRTKGVYFIFEPGENRATDDTQRIVRVGSNSGQTSSTESRVVGEHFKDWGRSVFRRHVGTAIILKGDFHSGPDSLERERLARQWYARVDGWAVHSRPGLLSPKLHPLHPMVTRTIGAMTILWVEIPDKTHRLQFEEQCIKLLSNCLRTKAPIDPPSAGWLGRYALNENVRTSGLWNVKHARAHHTPGFLAQFQEYFLSAK